jgi:hypothetical protein
VEELQLDLSLGLLLGDLLELDQGLRPGAVVLPVVGSLDDDRIRGGQDAGGTRAKTASSKPVAKIPFILFIRFLPSFVN